MVASAENFACSRFGNHHCRRRRSKRWILPVAQTEYMITSPVGKIMHRFSTYATFRDPIRLRPKVRFKRFGLTASRRGLQFRKLLARLFSVQHSTASKGLVHDFGQRHFAPLNPKKMGCTLGLFGNQRMLPRRPAALKAAMLNDTSTEDEIPDRS